MIKNLLLSVLNINAFSVSTAENHGLLNVKDVFDEYTRKLNITPLWRDDLFIEIEIKKSLLRSLVRYSEASVRFGLSLSNNDQKFLSPPYPMIHLSGDLSETGGYHIDQIGAGFFESIWVPITEYQYPGLSYGRYGYIKYILKKFNLINLNITEIPIDITPNSIYSWNGYFYHKGNKNKSGQISAALVIKRTQRPLILEAVLSEDSLSDCRNYSYEEILLIEKFIFAIYEFAKDRFDTSVDLAVYLEVINFLKDASRSLEVNQLIGFEKIASFSLCLFAQRIESYTKNVREVPVNCNILHLFSLLLGCENLLSLRKLSETKSFDAYKYELFTNLERFKAFNTYQWHNTLGDNASLNTSNIWK